MAAIKEITLSAKGQIVIPAERREDVLTRLEGKYATPGRSLREELHLERRAERGAEPLAGKPKGKRR